LTPIKPHAVPFGHLQRVKGGAPGIARPGLEAVLGGRSTRITLRISGICAISEKMRGVWSQRTNHGEQWGNLVIAVEGDENLFNQYGIILVNPEKFPHVKKDLGQTFIDWVPSAHGQKTIDGHKIDGQQFFFPNAPQKGS
jgi:ABC-type tungstate transport system permease subunit